jgi:hypothetical protein
MGTSSGRGLALAQPQAPAEPARALA